MKYIHLFAGVVCIFSVVFVYINGTVNGLTLVNSFLGGYNICAFIYTND